MVKKKGGKISCGQCHQFFNEDELILDEVNNRYLCDGCYEPREQDPEIEREKCQECGEYMEDCECDKDDIDDGDDIEENKEMNPVRTVRGEARVKRMERTKRVREITERDKLKSLIW